MVFGGGKTQEGAEKVGYVDKFLVTGRGKHTGVGNIFQGGGSGCSPLWVGDVGADPLTVQALGGFLEQGVSSAHIKKSVAESGRKLGIPPPRRM